MKKVVFTLVFLLGSGILFAQETTSNVNKAPEEQIYTSVEVKPEFPGGIQELYKYINSNMNVPDVKNLKGRVITQFIVEKDGGLSDIKIVKDIGHGTGEEAKRVLKNSPKWKPGVQNGTIVRVLYSLPITIGEIK